MDDDTLRWVDEAYEAGRSEWRELRLERECWKEFLLARKEAASAASHRILADLFLACACQHDVPGALQRFFETYGATIQAAVRPIDATPSFVDEARQRLAETLFVTDGHRPPRISQYEGRGPLGGWVRSAARRIALRLHQQQRLNKSAASAAVANKLAAGNSPDLMCIDARHRREFQDALQQAIAGLPRRERLLLRLHLLEGLSLSRIAKMQAVSQPTVSRWLQKAREDIVAAMRYSLRDRNGVNESEFESIVGLIGSRLDFSLSTAIGGDSSAL
jgi:RNA polymerase sigma-70 factor (ECF subfamily)